MHTALSYKDADDLNTVITKLITLTIDGFFLTFRNIFSSQEYFEEGNGNPLQCS